MSETVSKFRKRPVVIEAIRYSLENRDVCIAFSGASYDQERLCIDTLEGTMRASVGDWIIKGVKGEFYPCRNDVFNETYEPEEM